ncbi:MAG: CU044_2847 family protein [Cyanobacteria bacterium J06560_6]
MEKELAQFTLEDGTAFLVEVEEPRQGRGGTGVQRVATPRTGQLVLEANQTLEAALEQVKPVIGTVASKLRAGMTTPADEVEVTFGLKLSAAAGVVFSSVGGEVTFEVKLKWAKDKE